MTVRFPPERHEMLLAARARQQTPEFHDVYQARCGIEGTFSQTTRNTGLRRARYIGQRKTHLQHLFTALATNILRLVRWLEGIPFAKTRTSRFGGHTLFIKDQLLYYVYNFLGIPPEQQFVSPGPVPTGKHIFGAEFTKESTGQYGESHGTLRLYIDDNLVASGPMRTQTGKFSIAGEGLCVGRDSADAVSHEYTPEFPFRGGRIKQVLVDVGRDVYSDLEKEASAMLARE